MFCSFICNQVVIIGSIIKELLFLKVQPSNFIDSLKFVLIILIIVIKSLERSDLR